MGSLIGVEEKYAIMNAKIIKKIELGDLPLLGAFHFVAPCFRSWIYSLPVGVFIYYLLLINY